MAKAVSQETGKPIKEGRTEVDRAAATLSALQIGMFILLVWLPIVSGGHISAFQWGEFVVTCALTAGGWVVADSYRHISWFAMNKR